MNSHQDLRSKGAWSSNPRRKPIRRPPDDDRLAFELATAARPHLNRVDADRIYIAIGVGDVFTAMGILITVMARDRIPLGHDLIAAVAGWLDCYRGHDTEPRLRQLLTAIERHSPPQILAFHGTIRPGSNLDHDRRSG